MTLEVEVHVHVTMKDGREFGPVAFTVTAVEVQEALDAVAGKVDRLVNDYHWATLSTGAYGTPDKWRVMVRTADIDYITMDVAE